MNADTTPARQSPQILAPAGDSESFLAALAAGADAIYAGLKHFSARMEAANFAVAELARLGELAHAKGAKLYVPFNVLLKPGDMDAAGRLIQRLERSVHPDALIVQDLGTAELARQAGFSGAVHLSTLANVSHPAGLGFVARELADCGVSRVILPRELDVDEIKAMAAACPEGLELEVFVHGALCYGVSGRCYWSSFLGGKSGLRGRCVQPCRRMYHTSFIKAGPKASPKSRPKAGPRGDGKPGRPGDKRSDKRGGRPTAAEPKGRGERLFSCQDLSLDVLTRTLLEVPQVVSWKIEGRKKGAHYVYYVVSAYRTLRDGEGSPESKRAAMDYLEQALGREGTHYRFLPQRRHPAVTPERATASGAFAGVTGKPARGLLPFSPRLPLQRGDRIRVGYEDDPWHAVLRVSKDVPKAGRYDLRLPPRTQLPQAGKVPVFLIDRREPELIEILRSMERELEAIPAPPAGPENFTASLPRRATESRLPRSQRMEVHRRLPLGRTPGELGLWLRPEIHKDVSRSAYGRLWWWLPPVVWPDEEERMLAELAVLVRSGARRFVLNAPWQWDLLPEELRRGAPFGRDSKDGTEVWAGPFCNVANPLALDRLARVGFSGAVVSPELSGEDLMALPAHSPLPLGIVAGGMWPLCVSRTVAENLRLEEPLASPKGEVLWVRRYGPNVWVYPGWPVDLSARQEALHAAGYSLFVHLQERKPRAVPPAQRTSSFNWDLNLV